MLEAVEKNELQRFKKLFSLADDREIMYWHLVKCFKEA
jgi:hypothetical protein